MIWYRNLYVGESIRHKKKRIIHKIRHRSFFTRAYVITLSASHSNLLDIYAASEFHQKYFPVKQLIILGIAGDEDEAYELAAGIIMEVYTLQGDFDVRSYIKKNWEYNRKDGLLC